MKKYPKAIEGEGIHNSCFHLCVPGNYIRFQVNEDDVLFLDSKQDARRIGLFFLKAGKMLPRKRKSK